MEFLLLILYYLVTGLPLYCFFYNLFNDSRALFSISFSILLGFIFFNLYQLIFGHFGLPLTGTADWLYKISFAVITWGLYSFFKDRKSIKETVQFNFNWSKINKLGLFLTTLLMLFYIYTLKVINVTYFIPWDVFHYWLLDPKIIFETGYLRQGVDLIDMHKDYGSFLSVSISDLYELMGEVKERRAAYFTLMHSFLAGIILWQGISRNETYIKLFGFSVLIIILSAFSWGHWFYSSYTEVHCAFYILLFVYLLLSMEKFDGRSYYLRFFILLCTLYILVSIKPYYPQALFLTGVWIVYDFLNYRKEILTNINLKKILPLIALLVLLIISGKYYVSNFIEGISASSTRKNYYGSGNTLNLMKKVLTKLIPSSYEEGKEIYGLFDSRLDRLIPHFTLLIFTLFSVLFLDKKDSRIKYVLGSMLGIGAIFLLYVVFFFPEKANDSFFRYSTLFFFLIPLIFAFKTKFTNSTESKIFSIAFFTLALMNFFLSSFSPNLLNRKTNSGRFDSFPAYAQYKRIANVVKPMLTPDDKVFVVNGDKKINVRTKSILMVRYNLIENIVGGIRFQTRSEKELRNFLSNHEVDYLLVQNPSMDVMERFLNRRLSPLNNNTFFLIKINDLENDNFTITRI